MPSAPMKLPVLKKTPVASRYLRQLIRINDQVCFAAFRQWEFEQSLAPLITKHAADFTPTVFAANPFAETINRKLGDLPSFSGESEQVALRMSVIAGLEYCLAYLEEVQAFRQSLTPSSGDSLTNDAEEEQMRLKIENWLGEAPDPGYFRTLGFLRLIRNHYAHVNDEPSSSLKTYIRSHGKPLNKFWNNGITNLHGIDFKTLAGAPLTPYLAFGIMNLMRISIQHVDDMVANTLTLTHAVSFLIQDISRKPNNRGLAIKRLASKVKARLENDWGMAVSLQIAMNEIEHIAAAEL